MFNQIIKLIQETKTVNEYGDTEVTTTEKEVFAELRSVGMKESYEMMALGLKPEFTFVLSDYFDYDDEEKIVYEEKFYKVIRTYRKGINLEIVVTRDGSTE